MVDCNKYFKVLIFSEPFGRQMKCYVKKTNMFMLDATNDVTGHNMNGQNWMKMPTLNVRIVSGLPSKEKK